MKNKFKNQNGVISVFAMLAMLFFLLFILGAYMAVSRSNRTQKESNDEILKIYSTEVNAQEIYDEMISFSGDIRPIYTYEQFNDLGRDMFYSINGKVYDWQIGSIGKCELKSNLSIAGLNDKDSRNSKKIYAGEYQYIESNSMKLSLDGTNNTAEGFNSLASNWTNLVSVNNIYYYYNIYGGGKNPLSEGEVNWTGNGLAFDGSGDFVRCDGIIDSGNSSQTLEIVFRPFSANNQRLLGSWGNNAGGGLSISGSGLRGDFILHGNINRSVAAANVIDVDRITYAALTYDGRNICLYKNGKKVSDDSQNTLEKATTETITVKTIAPITKMITGSDKTVRTGLRTYIGKENSTSANGITISPYFFTGDGFMTAEFKSQGGKGTYSKIYIKDLLTNEESVESAISYYQNIADLKSEKTLMFEYDLNAYIQSGQVNFNVTINDPMGYKSENPNGIKLGSLDTNSSFSVISIGTDSMVIRSNIGKIQSWYFNGQSKGPSITNGEVEILGNYYYCFDGLEPYTNYEIKAEFKTSDSSKINIRPVTGQYSNSIFIGNSYNNKFDGIAGGSFNGIIYAVRVYDKALTSDQIGTNYKIDKSRFSIID